MARNRVRPFERDDIPQVIDVHGRAFAAEIVPPPAYFEEFYFRTPLADPGLRPLVYERSDGRITGFLGVMPRRYVMQDRTIRIAVAAKFMLDPAVRSATAGLTLLKTFLAGPQDISLADASNRAGRTLWQALRAKTVWPYNFQWTRRLRLTPSSVLRSSSAGHPVLRLAARTARPLLPLLDRAAMQISRLGPAPPAQATIQRQVDARTIIAGLDDIVGERIIRPHYDQASLDWLLRRAQARTMHGNLQKVGVWDREDKLLGWFIYYLKPGGAALLLQLVARPTATGAVLDSLFQHAWRGRATIVTGNMQPHLVEPLSARAEISFHLSDYWMMVHSKEPELLSAINRGDALLTRLDGEWSMAFHGEDIALPAAHRVTQNHLPVARRPAVLQQGGQYASPLMPGFLQKN